MMTSDEHAWLEKQIGQNDPVLAGVDGAHRLAQAIMPLQRGEGMAFGFLLNEADTGTLAEKAADLLRDWLGTNRKRFSDLDDQDHDGSLCVLVDAGVVVRPPQQIKYRVVLRFPANPGERDPTALDGSVIPWEGLRDSPCFDGRDWIVDGKLDLKHREHLVAELSLDCETKPRKRDLADFVAHVSSDFEGNDVAMQWMLPSGEADVFIETFFDAPTVAIERIGRS
jgi:uncharacterized protein YgfB (UPF0149 family)